MKPTLTILFCIILKITVAQPKVAVTSFFLDKEVDFSLMQAFNDDSKDLIQKLVDDPEFELTSILNDFYVFFEGEALNKFPFEPLMASVNTFDGYSDLKIEYKYEKPENHLVYHGFLTLGSKYISGYSTMMNENELQGIMTVYLQFFVRKNGLKTVIQTQVNVNVWNAEGKKALTYKEYGISKEGVTTFAGWVIDKKDEVMPMFTSSLENLKEKMNNNLEKRSLKSIKKL